MTREEREQALEWFKNRPITMSGAKKMYDLAFEALSADGDTISRQAAIDVLDKNHILGRGDINEVLDHIVDRLEKLPSVQPERTCVNCGRTVNNGGWYADGGTRCPIEEHYALPKDGYCHLWEKRNVTDDDYPERRTDEQTN